jgi:hypothetical protein
MEVAPMKQLLFILSTVLMLHSTTHAATPVAPVPQTGQTLCYNTAGTIIPCAGTGQDGDIKNGVAFPAPRFTDNSLAKPAELTVTDTLTGLMWTKDANAPGPVACGPATTKTWQGALDYAFCLNTSNYLGYSDWRVPTIRELGGLVDSSRASPALPFGHPFSTVHSGSYWSSTSYAAGTGSAWNVYMYSGYVFYSSRANYSYVWPVRSGQ